MARPYDNENLREAMTQAAGLDVGGTYRADPELARKRAYESAAQCAAENKVAQGQNTERKQAQIYSARQERVVAASVRLFAARERINILGMMNAPSDLDEAVKLCIEYNLAQADVFQAEHDLARAKQPV